VSVRPEDLDARRNAAISHCVGYLEWVVCKLLDGAASPAQSPSERLLLSRNALNARCAAEQLNRLLPQVGRIQTEVAGWVDEWEAGTAEAPPFWLGMRAAAPANEHARAAWPLVSEPIEAAAVEECARYLEAHALRFLKRANAQRGQVAQEWLSIHREYEEAAHHLRQLTDEGFARHQRNKAKVITWLAANLPGTGTGSRTWPVLEPDNTDH
jgi:hypothetical protein